MEKMKKYLFSEQGMAVVNVLFFLSLFIRNSGIIFAAYIVWILYLVNCFRKTRSKTVKFLYSIFIILASVMIVLNLLALIKTL